MHARTCRDVSPESFFFCFCSLMLIGFICRHVIATGREQGIAPAAALVATFALTVVMVWGVLKLARIGLRLSLWLVESALNGVESAARSLKWFVRESRFALRS